MSLHGEPRLAEAGVAGRVAAGPRPCGAVAAGAAERRPSREAGRGGRDLEEAREATDERIGALQTTVPADRAGNRRRDEGQPEDVPGDECQDPVPCSVRCGLVI